MKKYNKTIFWSYLIEFALSGLLYLLIRLLWSSDQIVQFISNVSGRLLTITVALLVASISLFGFFIKMGELTMYDKWLSWRGASKVYGFTYIVSIFIYTLTIILFVILETTRDPWLAHIACWFALMCIINLHSMIKNLWDLWQLRCSFEHERKKRRSA